MEEGFMEKALTITRNYLNEHGSMPSIIVVAESAKGDTYTWLGRFRKNKSDDQKVFCGLMRTAFSIHDITAYTCLISADRTSHQSFGVKEAVVATTVDQHGKRAKAFEVGLRNELTEFMSIEPTDFLEGMYLELLPTTKETLDASVVANINTYLSRLAYVPPSVEEVVTSGQDGLQFLFETGLD